MKFNILIMVTFILFASMTFAQPYKIDTFETKNHNKVALTFIKHGSLMIDFSDFIIQVDPVSMFANYSSFPKADLILITHEHEDHLDAEAIHTLTKSNTLIIMNEASYKKLRPTNGKIMKNDDKLQINNKITIEAVPAYNITKEHEHFHPRYRDNGYILTIDGLRIYIAGDTEDIPELKNFKNIDIAFLPVNQPYTMTVDQAIQAAIIISPKVFYPYHYSNTNVKHILEGLKGSSIDVRIRNME